MTGKPLFMGEYKGSYLLPYSNGNISLAFFELSDRSDTINLNGLTLLTSCGSAVQPVNVNNIITMPLDINEQLEFTSPGASGNGVQIRIKGTGQTQNFIIASTPYTSLKAQFLYLIHILSTDAYLIGGEWLYSYGSGYTYNLNFLPNGGYFGVISVTFTGNYTVRSSWGYECQYPDILNWVKSAAPEPPEDTDPFTPGGSSEPGGGGGDFADPSEDVTDPAVPDISAVDTGFITLFNPSVSQLNSLASYMWSAGFDLETFKKIFANPMDCILGLSILPKIVPAGGSRTVMVGNISTGVSMTVAASQYVKFDCGSVTVMRYSNSFLDYAPYTKVSIYLPFVGIRDIDTDDVMNKSVHVKYNIDILSGACTAFVICGGTTLYTYIGQCSASVPIAGRDWTAMVNGVLQIAGSAIGGVARAASIGMAPFGGGMAGMVAGGVGAALGGATRGAASAAGEVAASKSIISRSGNMGGMGGMMGVKTPFLIITRPQQAIPGQQNKYTGYPAFVTKELNELEGYTEIEEIHLENIPGTEQEITEIYNLLKSGVIL